MSLRLILAWLVHLYTASGVVVGFLAVLSIDQGNFKPALLLMALAVFIDATDGALARAARVKELIPWFDGSLLDNITDYFNYVIVAALFLLRANLLPPQDALWLACLPLLETNAVILHANRAHAVRHHPRDADAELFILAVFDAV